jgi:hypothetical protein
MYVSHVLMLHYDTTELTLTILILHYNTMTLEMAAVPVPGEGNPPDSEDVQYITQVSTPLTFL